MMEWSKLIDADQPKFCDIQMMPRPFPDHFWKSIATAFNHPSADIYRADLQSSNDPIFKLVLGKDLLLSFSFPKK
jgi:hypothetical protein